MDIEHLSKSQMILLTLFASFVSSVATGIVTFSLMQQAPPVITQTVNRVVEHTIEKAVPVHTALVAAPTEKVAPSAQTDSFASAVASAAPSLVRMYADDTTDSSFLGLGVVLTRSGLIAADMSEVPDASEAVAELSDGTRARARVVARDASSGIVFFSATTAPSAVAPAFKPIDVTASRMTLGQSIIVLGGKAAVRLGAGIITSIHAPDTAHGATIAETSIPESAIMPGSSVIDARGTLIGMSTGVSRQVAPGAIVSLYGVFPKDITSTSP